MLYFLLKKSFLFKLKTWYYSTDRRCWSCRNGFSARQDVGLLDRRITNIVGKLAIPGIEIFSLMAKTMKHNWRDFSSKKKHRYSRSRGTWRSDCRNRLVKVFVRAPLTRLYRFFDISSRIKLKTIRIT